MKNAHWASVDAAENVVGEYHVVGINEVITDHPSLKRFPVLEKIATDMIPRLRVKSAA